MFYRKDYRNTIKQITNEKNGRTRQRTCLSLYKWDRVGSEILEVWKKSINTSSNMVSPIVPLQADVSEIVEELDRNELLNKLEDGTENALEHETESELEENELEKKQEKKNKKELEKKNKKKLEKEKKNKKKLEKEKKNKKKLEKEKKNKKKLEKKSKNKE